MELPQKLNLQQERDFSEKINNTFTFISQNFKPLLSIILTTVLPLAIFQGLALAIFQSKMFKGINDFETNFSGFNSNSTSAFSEIMSNFSNPALWIYFLLLLITHQMVQLIVYGYMKVYLQEGVNEVTFEKVFNIVKQKFLLLFIYNFIILFIFIVALCLLVIPGIYLIIVFSLFGPIIIFEDRNFSESISRCFDLIKDKWWSTFGLLFITAIIVSMLNFVFQIPSLIVTMLSTLKLISKEMLWINTIALTIATLGRFLLEPITLVALGLQYFNLVERKDGVGLRKQIDMIGNNTSVQDTNQGDF